MDGPAQRLDKWLFFARVVKSRALASRLVESGYVRLNGARVLSSSKSVNIGDVLTVALERHTRVIRVRATGERRGPYREAQQLFEEVGAPTQTPPATAAPALAAPLATSNISE